MFQISLLSILLPHIVTAGKQWLKQHSGCSNDVSEGPLGASVEIRLGDLPASTSDVPLYLSWWSARKSAVSYNPLTEPAEAEVHNTFRTAYGEQDDEDFNGGKVQISEAGEATMRIHAPSTYHGHRHHDGKRDPHVHFVVCGQRGHPTKVVFTTDGLHIKGGCKKRGRSGAVSYKIMSARELHSNTSATILFDNIDPSSTREEKEQTNAKDWDALEFSDVYECLDETKVFDQFTSSCVKRCPAFADIARGQCVRREDSSQVAIVMQASWRLRLDCNTKCWKDTTPISRHSLRLALADHLDITFQEAHQVRIRRDGGDAATHAHVTVKVKTRRMSADIASSLLNSFLANASFATDVLGLAVHEIEQVSFDAGSDESAPGEDLDQYAQYYAPLESAAEQQARNERQGVEHSIAGVPIPNEIPMVAIIGAAAGVVLIFGSLLGFLCWRRRRQLRAAQGTRAAKGTDTAGIESNVKGAV